MADTLPNNVPVDEALIQYLCDRDVPCPGCGYNLRGLKLNTCPECGTTFSLGLHGHMPGFRGWLGAIIMTCIGMGFSLLLLTGGMMELLLFGLFSWIELFALGGFAAVVIAGVVMVVTLIRRRRQIWLRTEQAVSWHMIIGGALLVLPIGLLILLMLFAF